MRIDQYLVKHKSLQSRKRAQDMIYKGAVTINGAVAKKPSQEINGADQIEISRQDFPWVSRAGLKLQHAIEYWNIKVSDKICADFGACTGGFTDVLMHFGARKVYAIDVGHGQLAEKLKSEPRVINMEHTHIKDLNKDYFENLHCIAIDVSYISLEKVLPKAIELLGKSGIIIALIKPQFEVGKENIKKGVVKEISKHNEVIEKIRSKLAELKLTEKGIIDSPILGGKGNKEFLLYCKK